MSSPASTTDDVSLSSNCLDDLRQRAVDACKNAYCPYSRFSVGAAVLTASGEVFSGCNVENASYWLTICAERNAIFQAVRHGHRQLNAVVVYTPTPEPTFPCGACRQVILEFGRDSEVIVVCDGPAILQRRASNLLPEGFGPDNIGAGR